MLEGKSNPHGRKVNADVKIWFGIFGICQGPWDLNGSVFVTFLHHMKAAVEFEVVRDLIQRSSGHSSL